MKFFLLLNGAIFLPLSIMGQSLSLPAVLEQHCPDQYGSLRIALNNKGKNPLRLYDPRVSYPQFKVQLPQTPIAPSATAYIGIDYDFRKLPKEGIKNLLIKTNDHKKPILSIILLPPKED